jgi:magnesium transporter
VARWVDLLDPDAAAVGAALPSPLHPGIVERLGAPPHRSVRPSVIEVDGELVVTLVVPFEDRERDELFLQEVAIVASQDTVVTIRKTPSGFRAFDLGNVRDALGGEPTAIHVVHAVANEVGAAFLDLLDALDDETEELEDAIDEWPPARVRTRIAELRRDVLTIRRTLAPTRDGIRKFVDGRVDLPGVPQSKFADVYDTLLRASEHLEFSRDLIASLRDYQQSKIANEQNEVVKRLTVIASLLLFPTFVVGVYGQNFIHMPELHWRLGYLFSWAVIAFGTLAQLAAFRRLRWI